MTKPPHEAAVSAHAGADMSDANKTGAMHVMRMIGAAPATGPTKATLRSVTLHELLVMEFGQDGRPILTCSTVERAST